MEARGSSSDPSKFIPLVRKLAQEPRMQRISSEVVARLGERLWSRSLRAAFGLPPPKFEEIVTKETESKITCDIISVMNDRNFQFDPYISHLHFNDLIWKLV